MACSIVSPVQHKTFNKMANQNRTFLIEIPNVNTKQKAENLQEAFEKFRKSRQREMKVARIMEERALTQRQDVNRMNGLRQTFLEGLKKYFGVPYAKRYHDENSPYYNAPLFLDCCGLIRRVLLDLKEEFGFVVGGGNQAYMYDTLPGDIKEQVDMKPGDLVFISATYYEKPGKKWKRQRHDMVHVEIWLGEGEKTIGARWQKGVVQVFDSYKFVSKSYYNMKYHFKSIDTWLMGICKSFCPEHPWRSSVYDPGKKSIFAEDEEDQCQAAEEEEGSTGEQQQTDDLLSHEEQNEPSPSVRISKDEQNPKDETSTISCKRIEDSLNITIEHQCLMYEENAKKEFESTSRREEASDRDLCDFDHEQLHKQLFDYDKTNCSCPECCPIYLNCIHNLGKKQENGTINLEETSSNDLTSSLECFEVIALPECRREVEKNISTCPIEKVESNGNSGSSSPSKDSPNEGSNGSPTRDNSNGKKKGKDSPPKPVRDGVKSRLCHSGRQPAYYVSPGNGSFMVESTLQSLGWRKLEDRYDESFKLKWVECKSQIDYSNFREGNQLVNHISNIGVLTTKLGLLCSLQEYERVLDKIGSKQRIQLSDFVPETIRLTNTTEKQKFLNEVYKEGEVWICKPIGQNQGKGIYMINSSAQLRDKLHLNDQYQNTNSNGRRSSQVRPSPGRIIQRYIMNPLLLNNHKFDIRAYMFIASTNPYVVLYHQGYIRLSCVPYSPYSEEAGNSILLAHLTNQYIQKKHPSYSSMKEETVWSFERLQSYIDEHHTKEKGLAKNWMFTTFTKRMQQIMLTCFHSVRKKLHRRSGFFDLLGFDFMIDENFKVWLIEVNVNPSLNTNCQVLKDVIPTMVDSTVRIALEIFEKAKKGRPVFPLENKGDFIVLYNGEGKG
ncbi:probable beta-tubulin polyglutamylase [Actinia tenebrosa]|uniref:Probable beta-tubulin polyglutamylase n=1 Tax=Actinia tenebrosa TaxID=6105 RepID=A0A6P8HFB8_ACTTE|nr:probable beta-tubulin polyglutamylase [Actinia tenebrosa]